MVIAAIALLAPVTMANAAQSNASPVPGLVICLVVAVLFFLARVFLLPRLEFLPAQGALRTRRRTVSYAGIAAIDIRRERRAAGVWARFVADDGSTLTRMSLAASLCAKPTSEQWLARGHAISSAAHARGIPPTDVATDQRYAVAPGRAIEVAFAQADWLHGGRKRGPAPAKSLERAVIDLRA